MTWPTAGESVAAMSRWIVRHRWRMVHALRITAASLSGLAIAHAFGLSEGLWVVMTAIVVTQSSVGSSLKAVFDQFFGSLFGAVYAAGVALAIMPRTPLASAIALAVALAPLSILAAFSAGFRIAPITAAIILLGAAGLGLGPMDLAISRVLEVGLGCAVGLVVSVLLLPFRASRSVPEATAEIAFLLAAQLELLARGAGETHLASLAVRTRRKLNDLEVLVEEAARERRSRLADAPDAEPLLRTASRLRQDLGMLRRTARDAGRDRVHRHVVLRWLDAAEAGAATLRGIGDALVRRQPAAESDAFSKAVRGYRAALDEMRRAGLTGSLSTAELGHLFGLGFALDLFRRDLDDLAERSREMHASQARFPSVPPASTRRREAAVK